MDDRVAAAINNYHKVRMNLESKQAERESLRLKSAEIAQVKKMQEQELDESRNKEELAVDMCARGTLSRIEYQSYAEQRAACEKRVEETKQFMESIDRQLATVDAPIFIGENPHPQFSSDILTNARQDIFKILFEDLQSEIAADGLSKMHRAYACFFLMGGVCDWGHFLNPFLRLAPPSREDFAALTRELNKILEQKDFHSSRAIKNSAS